MDRAGRTAAAATTVGRGPGRVCRGDTRDSRSLIRAGSIGRLLCDEHAQECPDDLVDAGVADTAAQAGGDVEQLLTGSLVEQTRRCGKPDCRCAEGEPHGPYVYLSPRPQGRGRLRYVPAAFIATVRARLRRGEQVQAALAEISAINLELLTRRELD
jgi:hypothetical protein